MLAAAPHRLPLSEAHERVRRKGDAKDYLDRIGFGDRPAASENRGSMILFSLGPQGFHDFNVFNDFTDYPVSSVQNPVSLLTLL